MVVEATFPNLGVSQTFSYQVPLLCQHPEKPEVALKAEATSQASLTTASTDETDTSRQTIALFHRLPVGMLSHTVPVSTLFPAKKEWSRSLEETHKVSGTKD